MDWIIYYLKNDDIDFNRKTEGACGFDLPATMDNSKDFNSRQVGVIPTGIYLYMPPGFEAQIRPRSGLTTKHGMVAQFGTVDSDYRGEIGVTMINHGDERYTVHPRDRVAQLVFAPVYRPGWDVPTKWPLLMRVKNLEDLPISERGIGGWGSTGK